MATLFSDDFNRSDATTLGSGWYNYSGTYYTYTTRDIRIISNRARDTDLGSSIPLFGMSRPASLGTLTDAKVTYKRPWVSDTGASTGTVWMWLRYSSASLIPNASNSVNGYCCNIDGAGGINLYRRTNTTYTLLASSSGVTTSSTIVYQVQGTSLKVYVDGTLKVDTTDSSHSSGYFCMMMAKDTYTANVGMKAVDDLVLEDFSGGYVRRFQLLPVPIGV